MNDVSERTFIVRKAQRSDAEMLAHFYINNADYYFNELAQLQEHLLLFLDQPAKICLVAVCPLAPSSIIGFASVDLIMRPRGGTIGYLGEVLVDQSNRRLGLAKQLIAASLEQAASAGCHRIILHCESKLQKLYSTLGFQNWDTGMKFDISIHQLVES